MGELTPNTLGRFLSILVIFFLRFYLFFKKDFIYFYREEGKEKDIDMREKLQLVSSPTTPAGYLAHNPGMCPEGGD